MTRKLFLALGLLAAFGAAPLLSACNTVEGAGKDVSAAGQAVTGAAQDVKKAP
jgi:predicted small secreted protein